MRRFQAVWRSSLRARSQRPRTLMAEASAKVEQQCGQLVHRWDNTAAARLVRLQKCFSACGQRGLRDNDADALAGMVPADLRLKLGVIKIV